MLSISVPAQLILASVGGTVQFLNAQLRSVAEIADPNAERAGQVRLKSETHGIAYKAAPYTSLPTKTTFAMLGLQPFQYAGASVDARRVSLVQTPEFNDLLTATTEHGDIGIFTASGDFIGRHPHLAIEDDVLMVVTNSGSRFIRNR
jgi:hypothetical protein